MIGNAQRSAWERIRSRQHIWKRVVIAIGIIVIAIQAARLVPKPRGDFDIHWKLGQRLVAGDFLYFESPGERQSQAAIDERPKDHPYPPFWALVHAPLTLLPRAIAQLTLYPLFVVSLVGLLWTLHRLTEHALPVERESVFWISTLAVLLASRFLVRDMPECGVNLALVALSWLGVYLWTRRREVYAGTALGFAIALKCTPALFLAYFVWKRQWKMVAATTAAAILFTLSPALLMGPTRYAETMQFWTAHAWQGFGNPDPSMGVLGPEQLQNVSLRPALARFLMHLPEGHKSRFDHLLYFDFLNLRPVSAGLVVKLVLLTLLAAVAWAFRGRVKRRDDLTICWECAAVSILILLFSPITWGQHCVGLLPALYLFTRWHYGAGQPHPRWMYQTLGLYVAVILVLNRTLIGKDATWLLDSYRLSTWIFVGLLLVVVACHRRTLDWQTWTPADGCTSDAIRLPSRETAPNMQIPDAKERNRQQRVPLLPVGRESANLNDD